ncbi:hypothetical protein AMTRI_Chr13g117210 [Amborella trichopoda]
MQSAHGSSASTSMHLLHFQTALLETTANSSITALPPACIQKCSKICRPFLGRPPPGRHSGRLYHQHHRGCAQHAPNGTFSRAGGQQPPSGRDSLGRAWTACCQCTSSG